MTLPLVFFLEEESMKAALERIVPRVLPAAHCTFVTHQGKQDLEKSIPRKLRHWRAPARFVIIRDQDAGDCRVIKQRLIELCRDAAHDRPLIRIACRELEAWFLGDLQAWSVRSPYRGSPSGRTRRNSGIRITSARHRRSCSSSSRGIERSAVRGWWRSTWISSTTARAAFAI